jgi:hypothetical protein
LALLGVLIFLTGLISFLIFTRCIGNFITTLSKGLSVIPLVPETSHLMNEDVLPKAQWQPLGLRPGLKRVLDRTAGNYVQFQYQ